MNTLEEKYNICIGLFEEINKIRLSNKDKNSQDIYYVTKDILHQFVSSFIDLVLTSKNIPVNDANFQSLKDEYSYSFGNQFINYYLPDIVFAINKSGVQRNGNMFFHLFEKSYDWLIAYYQFIEQPELKVFDKERFCFALKYFSILNFQCIKQIEAKLPIDAQFVVFTGENGDGKTSILQALGLGLYNSDDLTDSERGKENTAIQLQYKSQEESHHNELYNNPRLPILYSLRHKMVELKPFAAYGASRLKVVEKNELQNPLLNLDTDKAKLFDIFESWLPRLSVNKPERFEKVKALLVSLLPNISDIVKKDENEVVSDFVFIEKGNKVAFKHLSAGHKSIVLMIGDMLMRLSEAQPKIDDPKDLAGIVLIDELEAHLHPKWQKEFPKILAEIFPKVQFIVTTHSAITLLGMPKNTVFFKVTRTEEDGTQIERLEIEVENLLPNQILTSPLFDLDVLPTYNENLNEVNTANTFQEVQRRKDLDIKLKELSKKLQKID